MKINELLVQAVRSDSTPYQKEPVHFESWLQTPTKENKGDEYYWQHQDQLQNSSLHFTACSINNTPTPLKNNSEQPNLIADKLPIHKDSNSEVLLPVNKATEDQRNNNPCSIFEYFLADKWVSNNPSALVPTNSSSILKEQPRSIKNTLPVKQASNNTFKNHHLFLEDHQVELTVNLNQINTKDQKKILHLIKEHLKTQGLALNKLIINGVLND